MHHVTKSRCLAAQWGFSLIEVLVSVIISSLGLVGVFGLHVYAKRASLESFNHTNAITLASDLIERIRLNPNQQRNYAGIYGAGLEPEPSQSCAMVAGSANHCSEAELLRWDRHQWEQQIMGLSEQRQGQWLGASKHLLGCVYVDDINVEVVLTWASLGGSSDAAQNHNENAKQCGTAGAKRRQVVLTTMVMDSL
ncbi:MAG: type IV pilus modification protein PilV [Ferrimonas sp.]